MAKKAADKPTRKPSNVRGTYRLDMNAIAAETARRSRLRELFLAVRAPIVGS